MHTTYIGMWLLLLLNKKWDMYIILEYFANTIRWYWQNRFYSSIYYLFIFFVLYLYTCFLFFFIFFKKKFHLYFIVYIV